MMNFVLGFVAGGITFCLFFAHYSVSVSITKLDDDDKDENYPR